MVGWHQMVGWDRPQAVSHRPVVLTLPRHPIVLPVAEGLRPVPARLSVRPPHPTTPPFLPHRLEHRRPPPGRRTLYGCPSRQPIVPCSRPHVAPSPLSRLL